MKTKYFLSWLFQNAFKLGLFCVLCLFLLKSDFRFQFNINSSSAEVSGHTPNEELSLAKTVLSLFDQEKQLAPAQTAHPDSEATDEDLANDYSNMTYHNTSQLTGKAVSGATKKAKQLAYVKRFAEVARSEMRKYTIPASITLAQGLIESNAGESRLSRENNNHFGMKCFSQSCKKGHCSNFTDDSHKDFFRKYATAWESYRAHSLMLGGKRYRHLKKLPASDYKSWAYGLKKAGYATDKRYAEKLIHIIEELKLYRYDQ